LEENDPAKMGNLMTETMNPTVEYRAIPGFPGYLVGADGAIWSCLKKGPQTQASRIGDKWKKVKASAGRGNYLLVILCGPNGERRTVWLHTLVLEIFVGPCPEGMEARHFPDRTRSNCAVTNLRWGTPTQNAEDRDRDGNTAKGAKN
jgi:hypothetical protein